MSNNKIGVFVYRMSGVGGVQKIISDKINAWIENYGYEVVLITKGELDVPIFYDINKKCKRYNLGIKTKTSGGVSQLLKNIPKTFDLYFKLKRILKKEKINVLFTTMGSIDSLIIPFIYPKTLKILEFHRSNFKINKKAWLLKKLIIRKYDKVVVLNKSEVDYLNLNNIEVIPNFTNIKDYDFYNDNRRNIIISAGRISHEKQFDHLIDIWSKIADHHLDWKVHIYGSGSADYLNQKIKEKELEKSFKIFPSTNEIILKMKEAKIFVMVSASEAFPMVILEAMASKLPIVSYNSPHGPANIISDGIDGIIVDLNDKLAFSEKLSFLIENPEYRDYLVDNQKSKIDQFSQKTVMKKWNDLICEMLTR